MIHSPHSPVEKPVVLKYIFFYQKPLRKRDIWIKQEINAKTPNLLLQ